MTNSRMLEKIEDEKKKVDPKNDPCKAMFLTLQIFRAQGFVHPDVLQEHQRLNTWLEKEMKEIAADPKKDQIMPRVCGTLKANYSAYVRGVAGMFGLVAESFTDQDSLETSQNAIQRINDVTLRMRKCQARFFNRDSIVTNDLREAEKIKQNIAEFQKFHTECFARRNQKR